MNHVADRFVTWIRRHRSSKGIPSCLLANQHVILLVEGSSDLSKYLQDKLGVLKGLMGKNKENPEKESLHYLC